MRITIVALLLVLVFLSFASWLGPVRGLFRGILVLGVIVIVLSYAVEWVQKRRR